MPYDVGSSSYAGQSASQPAAFLDGTLVRCPLCSQARFFKGERGLRRSGQVSASAPSPTPPVQNIQLWQTLSKFKNSIPILKRVPRGARASVASSLARCIALVARENSPSAWEQLLTFPFRILHVQKDLASKKTLTTQIKDNCFLKTQPFDPKLPVHFSHKGLLHHVESKLADGDIRGAARVLFSSDVVAAYSAETVTALQNKIIRHTLSSILNVALDDRAWQQATLPIRMGGLGVRKISSISLPAFLSSVHSTSELVRKILSPSLASFEVPCLTDAVEAWKMACPLTDLPVHPSSQRQWDVPLCVLFVSH
ncbi:hypothetical protein SFRURICE_006862 [Spodoptera frugiperda]|nr:hypothetical protein SFRURICE_006862 [Spodoptera frugiperda]